MVGFPSTRPEFRSQPIRDVTERPSERRAAFLLTDFFRPALGLRELLERECVGHTGILAFCLLFRKNRSHLRGPVEFTDLALGRSFQRRQIPLDLLLLHPLIERVHGVDQQADRIVSILRNGSSRQCGEQSKCHHFLHVTIST